ncbi:hypothetical protein EJ110_NYTH50895 [Nymphaea thermarum]|nr:hypothetical protein EJ110_NYTH50895 [Nymphaea thermarum]
MASVMSNASSYTSFKDEGDDLQQGKTVTSCVYLRSASSEKNGGEHQQPLDKQVVLRRIRHQKRVNKVQTAFNTFLPQQLLPEDAAKQHCWMDDPFSP